MATMMKTENCPGEIELLSIRLKHVKNELAVTKALYEKTTEQYFTVLEDISEKSKQLKEEISTREQIELELRKNQSELEKQILNHTEVLRQTNLELKRDVDELEQAKKALRDSEHLYHSTIDSINDTMHLIDRNYTILMHNTKLEEWLKHLNVHGSIIGSSLFDLCPFLSQETRDEYERVFTHKKAIITEEENRIGDSVIITETRKIPVLDNGNITHVITLIRDITEKRKLEEQIRVRQSMDSLGTLAGGIAHDFNNILAGIMGYLNLMQMKSDTSDESQIKYLKEAQSSCRRAAGLIQEFQSLSANHVMEKSVIDISEIATEVFAILESSSDKLIEIRNEIEPGKYNIYGMPDQIHQVLLNLGTNSLTAIENKNEKKNEFISISAEEYCVLSDADSIMPKGSYIHISFRDSGIGMSSEVKRHAFEPLFTTKKRKGNNGQGLGLAMVYQIITNNHKGFVTIDSESAKGTAIHLFLPKADIGTVPVQDELPVMQHGSERILIVEDEIPIRALLSEALSEHGYSVITATNGIEGLQIFIKEHASIDLVILDLSMPKMSGETLLGEIKKLAPDTKVLISSGHAEHDLRKNIMASGYLAKPYELCQLLITIRMVLDHNS